MRIMGTLSALLPAVFLWGSLSEARTVNLFDGSREVFESHWMEKRQPPTGTARPLSVTHWARVRLVAGRLGVRA